MNTPVRLVIADDAAQLRQLLAQALTKSGEIVVVGEAADGQQAIDVVDSTIPDVLLLDLSMPLLDGLEVLQRVTLTHPGIAVIVFSGYGTQELEVTCRALGAFAYMKKGTPIVELTATIMAAAQTAAT